MRIWCTGTSTCISEQKINLSKKCLYLPVLQMHVIFYDLTSTSNYMYRYVCKLLVHLIWKLYSFMNDIVNFRKWCVTGSTLTCTARSWCTYWLRRRRVDPTSEDCARNYRKVLKPGQYTVQWTEFSLYSILQNIEKFRV